MNAIAALLLVIVLYTQVDAQTAKPQFRPTRLTSTRDLTKYVGTYPCSNGLLRQQVLLSALRSILGDDYPAYRAHMKLSGCGAIEKRDKFLLLDVSQLHVGGYTSMIFVRVADGAVFLFWLKSTVAEKQWGFYGPQPIPTSVSQIVGSELNEQWGHVAQFSVHGDAVQIRLHDLR